MTDQTDQAAVLFAEFQKLVQGRPISTILDATAILAARCISGVGELTLKEAEEQADVWCEHVKDGMRLNWDNRPSFPKGH